MGAGAGASWVVKKIWSQYTQRLVTMRTWRSAERNLPVRSTRMVRWVPLGNPMSSMTVTHFPLGVANLQVGRDHLQLPVGFESAGAVGVRPENPTVEPQTYRRIRRATSPKSSVSECKSAMPRMRLRAKPVG